MESIALLFAASLNAGTVLAIASLGLLINEKAGIVNLGAEGMMLCAALAGFAALAAPMLLHGDHIVSHQGVIFC